MKTKAKKKPKVQAKGPYAGITLDIKKPQKISKAPIGMQPTKEVPKSQVRKKKEPKNTFTEMETGQPDGENTPDADNPEAVQGGRGPLNQEGEGERQNDQLAELEEIEPEE